MILPCLDYYANLETQDVLHTNCLRVYDIKGIGDMADGRKKFAETLKWIQDNTLPVMVAVGVIAVLSIAWWAYQDRHREQLREASDLLYRAQTYYESQFDLIQKEMQQARTETMPQSFLELESRYLNVIKTFKGSSQAQVAALDLSKIYFDLKQKEQAPKVLDMVPFSPALKPLLWIRKAYFFEEMKDYTGSQKMWKMLLSDQHYGKPFHGVAKLHLARMFFVENKPDEARAYLDEVEKEYEGKLEAREAEKIRLYYGD